MMQLITGLDTAILQYLFANRDITTTLSFINITELGSTVFVCGITLCAGLFLAYQRRFALAFSFAVSVLGSGATALLLKMLIHRARPDIAFQAYREIGFSFPSGHATLAAAGYGFLIYLACRLIPAGHLRTLTISGLTFVIILIAFSRLYLGVHYLSDVIGGLLLGGIFVWIGSLVVKKFEQRI